MKWPSTTTGYNYLSHANILESGNFKTNNIPIYFAELPRFFSSGLIGKEFLHNFILTIDYINDEIILNPAQNKDIKKIVLQIKKMITGITQ